MDNLAKLALENKGSIHPLIIPAELTNGTGIMNPSICFYRNKLLVVIRHINYTLYHSEKKLFPHQFGPITYVHPENDMNLRTNNYCCELDDNYNVIKFEKIDMSNFDNYRPAWHFIGLEDARIFEWEDKLYISGVRRDVKNNGEGRIEISEIVIHENEIKEKSRFRIPTPKDPNSYCEKNWMPILDLPYHYVKWSNPTEVVKIDFENKICTTTHLSDFVPMPRDLRGGSQVLSWENGYLAITHETLLFKDNVGRKDATYRHRFIFWDKNFNIIKYSEDFSFMNGHVEFCAGMAKQKNDFLITFGFQDNAAYLLRISENTIKKLLKL